MQGISISDLKVVTLPNNRDTSFVHMVVEKDGAFKDVRLPLSELARLNGGTVTTTDGTTIDLSKYVSDITNDVNSKVDIKVSTLSKELKAEIEKRLKEIGTTPSQPSTTVGLSKEDVDKLINDAKTALSTDFNQQISDAKKSVDTSISTGLKSATESLSKATDEKLAKQPTVDTDSIKTAVTSDIDGKLNTLKDTLEKEFDKKLSEAVKSSGSSNGTTSTGTTGGITTEELNKAIESAKSDVTTSMDGKLKSVTDSVNTTLNEFKDSIANNVGLQIKTAKDDLTTANGQELSNLSTALTKSVNDKLASLDGTLDTKVSQALDAKTKALETEISDSKTATEKSVDDKLSTFQRNYDTAVSGIKSDVEKQVDDKLKATNTGFKAGNGLVVEGDTTHVTESTRDDLVKGGSDHLFPSSRTMIQWLTESGFSVDKDGHLVPPISGAGGSSSFALDDSVNYTGWRKAFNQNLDPVFVGRYNSNKNWMTHWSATRKSSTTTFVNSTCDEHGPYVTFTNRHHQFAIGVLNKPGLKDTDVPVDIQSKLVPLVDTLDKDKCAEVFLGNSKSPSYSMLTFGISVGKLNADQHFSVANELMGRYDFKMRVSNADRQDLPGWSYTIGYGAGSNAQLLQVTRSSGVGGQFNSLLDTNETAKRSWPLQGFWFMGPSNAENAACFGMDAKVAVGLPDMYQLRGYFRITITIYDKYYGTTTGADFLIKATAYGE